MQDFYNLKPALTEDAWIIFDDFNIPRVAMQVNTIIQSNHLLPIAEYPRYNDEKYSNDILRLAV